MRKKGVSWVNNICFEKETPMRTPQGLYAYERIIYHPELLTCPHCGDLLVMCKYLGWDKGLYRSWCGGITLGRCGIRCFLAVLV